MRCLNVQCTARHECAKYAERDNPALSSVNVSGVTDRTCPFFKVFKNSRLSNIGSLPWIGGT